MHCLDTIASPHGGECREADWQPRGGDEMAAEYVHGLFNVCHRAGVVSLATVTRLFGYTNRRAAARGYDSALGRRSHDLARADELLVEGWAKAGMSENELRGGVRQIWSSRPRTGSGTVRGIAGVGGALFPSIPLSGVREGESG